MKKLYTIIALFSISFLSAQTLFFSEYAEGSANHKYLEIYNPTDAAIDLSGYSVSSCNNGCDETGEFDYPDNITFDAGTTLASGEVYIIANPSSDPSILAVADQTFTYLSNGDDFFALTVAGATASSYTIIDKIGDFGPDPGAGWDVAGETSATKDHTLVRKSSITEGNTDWSSSSNSEWVVLDKDTWTYLGSHPHASLSIFDFGDIKIDVYPNPVQTKLNFSGLTSPVQATVFDMLGKRQLQSEVINSLDVSSLKSGLYMVEIKNENSAKVFNILKK